VRVPAALVAIPLLAGAAAGLLLLDRAPDHARVAAAGVSLIALVAACGFFLDRVPPGVVSSVALGALAAGYASGAASARDLHAPSLLEWFAERPSEGDPVVIEGRLRDDGARVSGGVLLSVAVTSVCTPAGTCRPVRGGVRLTVGGTSEPASMAAWRAGRVIRAPATLRRPASFSNPGAADDTRGLARRGIALTGTVKSGALVEVVSAGSRVEEAAAAARAWARTTLAAHVGTRDARSGAVATAILIGDRTGLSSEDERRLQEAGTYHVIAISGGNIAILAAVLVFGARAVRVPYRAAAALSAAFLLFYGEVAGGAPSVGRAVTAAVIFLAALALDQRGSSLNVLAIAAVIAVAVLPATVLDAGFLLSFGATAGIILGVPALVRLHVGPTAGRFRRAARAAAVAAAGVFTATVCAEIALLPVAASLFSRVTVAGLVLNFAAIPLMTIVQCGSLALLAAAPVHPPLAAAAGEVVHRAAEALVESSRLVDVAPWVARDVPRPAVWLCAVYYVAALGALRPGRHRRAALAALALAGLAVFTGAPAAARGLVPSPRPGVLRVVVLDVGQGDATAATLPDGRTILVDAGGLAGTTFDVAGRVVLPALRALRVRRLHALVITHPDPDHIGGADAVLRRLAPAYVWEGIAVPPHEPRQRLVALAAATRAVWRTVRPDAVERAGGVDIIVHHPPEPDWERQRVRNDDSVVLELRHGDVSILLPGDIGREVEASLIPRLQLAPVVVLKAAHHGSATSSSEAFIEAIGPAAVIFSAGRGNPFGHPAPVVVDRFARRGIPMFTTAHDGAVFVETDGASVDLRAWRTGRRLVITKNTKATEGTAREER